MLTARVQRPRGPGVHPRLASRRRGGLPDVCADHGQQLAFSRRGADHRHDRRSLWHWQFCGRSDCDAAQCCASDLGLALDDACRDARRSGQPCLTMPQCCTTIPWTLRRYLRTCNSSQRMWTLLSTHDKNTAWCGSDGEAGPRGTCSARGKQNAQRPHGSFDRASGTGQTAVSPGAQASGPIRCSTYAAPYELDRRALFLGRTARKFQVVDADHCLAL